MKNELKVYINPDPPEKPSLITREGIDIMNSLCWLLMDAFWMFNLPRVGLLFGLPTLISAVVLLYRERRNSVLWINMATNCWVIMNILWMMSDTFNEYEPILLKCSKVTLGIGIFCVATGAFKNGSIGGAIAHYKRYKSLGQKKMKVVS